MSLSLIEALHFCPIGPEQSEAEDAYPARRIPKSRQEGYSSKLLHGERLL